jgi:hypothetical protein
VSTAAAERPEVAVVRHPIADGRNNVVGYELRFGGAVDLGDPSRDAKGTSALLVEAFGDIGLERLAGRHPAWVSIARNFLVEIGPPPVRPDRAVLQIDAYPARDDLLGLLQSLSRSGYTLALNDYDGRDDIQELMSLCSIVKVDVTGRGDDELAGLGDGAGDEGGSMTQSRVVFKSWRTRESRELAPAIAFAPSPIEHLRHGPALQRARSAVSVVVTPAFGTALLFCCTLRRWTDQRVRQCNDSICQADCRPRQSVKNGDGNNVRRRHSN